MFDISLEPKPGLGALNCDTTDQTGHCLTCSDALETFRVIELLPMSGLALAQGQQGQSEIDISLLEEGVEPGGLVLVHGGVALSLAEESGLA